jgi:hypothetical protein
VAGRDPETLHLAAITSASRTKIARLTSSPSPVTPGTSLRMVASRSSLLDKDWEEQDGQAIWREIED